MDQFKFYLGQKVQILNGWFEGTKGFIVARYKDTSDNERYYINHKRDQNPLNRSFFDDQLVGV